MGIKFILNRDASALIIMVFAALLASSIVNYDNPHLPPSFHSFSGLMCGAFIGLILTDDIFNFYVFLELASVSIYVLLALGQRSSESYRAAFNYLIIGSVSGMLILLGILMLYGYTGTLNMSLIADAIRDFGAGKINSSEADRVVAVLMGAYVLMTLALTIKLGLFPMSSWLLRCYLCNHSHAILLFVGIAGKVIAFAILKINHMFGLYAAGSNGHLLSGLLSGFANVFVFLGALTIIVLAVQALLRSNKLKNVIMLSSLSQNGYWIVAIFCNSAVMRQSFMIQLIGHTIAITTLLALYGIFESKISTKASTNEIGGLLRAYSINPVSFLIPMLSIVGIPFTVGFLAKWQLLRALFTGNNIALVIVILFGTIMALLYSFKAVEGLIFSTNVHSITRANFAVTRIRLLTCGCIILLLLLGVFTQPVVNITSGFVSAWSGYA